MNLTVNDSTEEIERKTMSGLGALINKLLDGFDGKLISSKWAKIAKCSKDTAIRDINDLIDKEILRTEEAERRSTNYELNRSISC